MSNYKTAAQLKGIAKEKSLGRYGTLIGANLLILAIQLLVGAVTTVSSGGSIIIIVINSIISIIVNILLGLLMSGKAYLYMNLLYSQNVATSDIFYGLRQNSQKAVAIQAVFVLVDFVVSLPAQIFLVMYMRSQAPEHMMLTLLTWTLGLFVDIMVSLIYSQSFFLLHDFPDRSAKELLATSRRLMRGNKFRLFYLNVSFIPLYIFGAIALFVPILWVSVYRYASTCAFYQDLIAGAGQSGDTE
ncbi:DUF975 family protein [Butyrivibrio sp. CB08]|uniref:DUF975 family protein n=1 Tax=Butyrivibrio sp. CB08 TaxID=2364879 RepID=UPI000EA83D81|nr:DUF975 family protein [Butyrivibrio sp. CB08]RKM56158.1 DUF975 family protein [Butyrivibrio sp. CB08]